MLLNLYALGKIITIVNNKINTLESVGLKTYFYFTCNIKIIVFEQLRVSISHLTTASTKEEMFEDKVALKRPSPWPLKGQNPVPITHTVEKFLTWALIFLGIFKVKVKFLETKESRFFFKEIIKTFKNPKSHIHYERWEAQSPIL